LAHTNLKGSNIYNFVEHFLQGRFGLLRR